jgi:hypothetical protein
MKQVPSIPFAGMTLLEACAVLGVALRWAASGLAEWAAVACQLCVEGFGTLHLLAFLSAAL